MTQYFRVVTNKTRPYLASNYPWGSGGWTREIHHIAEDPGHKLYLGAKTLCGRDCSDWIIVDDDGPLSADEAFSREASDLCKRCASKQ